LGTGYAKEILPIGKPYLDVASEEESRRHGTGMVILFRGLSKRNLSLRGIGNKGKWFCIELIFMMYLLKFVREMRFYPGSEAVDFLMLSCD